MTWVKALDLEGDWHGSGALKAADNCESKKDQKIAQSRHIPMPGEGKDIVIYYDQKTNAILT